MAFESHPSRWHDRAAPCGLSEPDHSNISDRQLRAVIDTIPALVWLANTEGAAEHLNRRWLDYTGLTQAQAVGWGWTVAVHPEDLDRLTNYWRSVLQSGVRGETEARLRRVDGEYGWFKFTAEPLHDQSGTVVGWCGTNIDIIEEANRALQASERELTVIIETIPGFVWRASTDGQLTYVNNRLFEYIGAPVDSLRGNGWLEYVHPDDRAAAIDNWMRSVTTGLPLENQVPTAAGRRRIPMVLCAGAIASHERRPANTVVRSPR